MRGLARRFAEQLAHPDGVAGRAIGCAMDLANRRPTRLALELLDAQPGERILDAGCGTGATLARLLNQVPVAAWGVDPSPAMRAAAQHKLAGRACVQGVPIEEMSFADDMFDAVLALNVLYFADPDGLLISQLHRVLRPGGRLIAYVTRRATMEKWSFARKGVHRLFESECLVETLCSGGFATQRIYVQEHAITRSVDGLLAIAVKEG